MSWKGVELVHVWEDDYNTKRNLIHFIIANKLGVNSYGNYVYAQETVIEMVDENTGDSFLTANHLRGKTGEDVLRVGLFDKKTGTLVALMVLKTEPSTFGETLNLLRYATSVSVEGGFSKLLSFVEETYKPRKIIVFSDHCIDNESLYKNTGFVPVKNSPQSIIILWMGNGNIKHSIVWRDSVMTQS